MLSDRECSIDVITLTFQVSATIHLSLFDFFTAQFSHAHLMRDCAAPQPAGVHWHACQCTISILQLGLSNFALRAQERCSTISARHLMSRSETICVPLLNDANYHPIFLSAHFNVF